MKNKPVLKVLQGLLVSSLALLLFSPPPAHAQNTLLLQTHFEDGTTQGWTGRGGVETLAAASEAARSGSYGLRVGNFKQSWHGPTLDVTAYLEPGQTYVFSGWIKLPPGVSNTTVYMTMQRKVPSTTYYERLYFDTATSSNWVNFKAQYKLLEAADNLSVYFEASNNATLVLHLDDFRLEKLPDLGPIVIEDQIPSLKDVFASDFLLGTAFSNDELIAEADRKLLAKHFNSVTPGNVLKWDSTEPQEGVFDFSRSDAAVQFAIQNGQQVRGHTLVWHSQTPDWVFRDASGNLASKELLFQRMRKHITEVMGRYQGQISAWDVVNEVIDASQPDGLRRSTWYQIAGEEFIEKAFLYAREADPSAALFINDYNTHEAGKSQALYNLIQRLKAKGIPVDGVGHQTHISLFYPTIQEIERSIIKFADLGVETHITELDVSVYSQSSQRYDTFPEDLKQKQAALYKQLFDVFKMHKNQVTSVTLWGKDDANTWLRTFPVARNDWPLLFDERLQSKLAYWAIVNATPIPSPPTGLTATAGNGRVGLGWIASSSATSYNVKRATVAGGPYTPLATVSSTSYSDTSVTNGTTYHYVVSARNSAGESANSAQLSATPQGTSTPPPQGTLVVQYRAADTHAGDNGIKPHFKIQNHGSDPVMLSELAIRYWFTIDGEKPLAFDCDYARVGSSNVTGRYVTLSTGKTGADHALEITFNSSAGSIPAGGDSGEIQTRTHKTDWSNFNESDDYSFELSKTSFSHWERVTLYRNGQLVWGTEPP
ncbi:endo-1,4-beta-xylanase [Stigmatella sp. ncwal1]|uniref:Beta-xylanase n=1 Tax=Stigmatella ashevillensis TaxID=2995309 RepID=A0ABT5D7R9_9BACT|nr:endo-1,4-beta-xylanase [Stigmatella ashevillena]MDC0708903.1 endo-1,4-beta-xylanase [Stigmatella ashevillena]